MGERNRDLRVLRMSSSSGPIVQERAPVPSRIQPPFTLKQIRDAVPARCFERSALRSGYYAARDLFFACLLWFLVAPLIDRVQLGGVLGASLKVVLWVLFGAAQGTILTGVWVVAHEAGHGAFSPSDTINNVVGTILHTFLLVPFFSWKFTHAAHHGATNHMRKDQVFVPHTRQESVAAGYESLYALLEDTPLLNFFYAARMFLIGWPMYLLINVSGQEADSFSSHFLSKSRIFNKDQRFWVTVSNWALVGWLGVLSIYINRMGAAHFVTRYLLPYMGVNFWLIFYTYMQHTDQRIPHYEPDEWNFVRGALCTIDRPYHAFDFFHHEIGTSHAERHQQVLPDEGPAAGRVDSDPDNEQYGGHGGRDEGGSQGHVHDEQAGQVAGHATDHDEV